MRTLLWGLCLFLASNCSLLAAEDAQKIVALVDYIAGDYKNAVQLGKVINQDEYQEMMELSARALELLNQLKTADRGDKAGIGPSLKFLSSQIEKKESEKAVTDLARGIKEKLIAAYQIVPHPKTLPSYQAGEKVFAQNCAQCHGEGGKGDGPSRETITPKEPAPTNFTDPEIMAGLSPFKAFNTVSFGVERTAMPSFSALSEEERWQAAFYLFSFRFSPKKSDEGKRLLGAKILPENLKSVATLAALPDEELLERLDSLFPDKAEAFKALAYLRRGLLQEQRADPLMAARTLLGEAITLYGMGEREKAYQRSADAYLDGFELAEPALFARDASFGRKLEAQFTEFRGLLKRGDNISRIRELYNELDKGLAQASEILSSEDSLGGSYTFFNAALIILREGLEAALIVSAIVAVLKVTGAVEAVRYVHLGWGIALISGIVTWALAQTVLTVSGAQREVMEGFTSILAALVLFSVSYWLISKAEARKWQKYIQAKVHEALTTRRIMALVGVSFLAVYREAFETVLFYQALWLQSQNAQALVIWGFLGGVALLTGLVLTIFRLGLIIPLRHFFGVSSALLYLLAFVFAGEGIKDLQATGWFSETPLQYLPQVPWLGIYPTLETLLGQGLIILALVGALVWLGRENWHGAN